MRVFKKLKKGAKKVVKLAKHPEKLKKIVKNPVDTVRTILGNRHIKNFNKDMHKLIKGILEFDKNRNKSGASGKIKECNEKITIIVNGKRILKAEDGVSFAKAVHKDGSLKNELTDKQLKHKSPREQLIYLLTRFEIVKKYLEILREQLVEKDTSDKDYKKMAKELVKLEKECRRLEKKIGTIGKEVARLEDIWENNTTEIRNDVEDKGEDVDDDESGDEGEDADDDDSEDEGEDADDDDPDEDVEIDAEGEAAEEEYEVPPPPPLQPEDEAHKEASKQLGMTTKKNSPKRSEPKVKRPTPNLDDFKKSVLSSKEWIDTTFKNITDKQEEIQSVAEALFGESNKALRNSLLERTNAVVRKLLEEKGRLERLIFNGEHGDKNIVRMSDRYQKLCSALKPIVKSAIDKLDKILAEIEKIQNGTSTSSESSSMAPPLPPPLEDDVGDPPPIPPEDDIDDVPPPPPPEDDIDDVPPPPPEDDSNEVTFQDQEDSSSKNKHKKGIVAKLIEKFENKGGIAKAAGRRKILADAVFEINKDIKIVINKCDELLMRSEGSTDPKLKREILDLREKFLNGEKDISRKIFGNKEVSDLINSKKLSDKLLWKVQNYMLDVYYLFEGINSELNRISQKMDVHEMHDASKSLWLKPPKFEPPPLDANDPKLTEDWINYVTDFFKKSNGQ